MLRHIPYVFAAALVATPVLAEITVTDLDGRTVTIADVPEKVALGFYYEDYLAVTGPEGIDKLVAISREPWEGWRPGQWEAYTAVFPQIEDLPDFGNADGGTLSIETIIAADLLGIDPFDQPAVEEGKVLAREYLREQARR